ncbi:glycosyltransferase [Brevibacillus sp. SYP-B805]|uniref:CgeB family protein n=1 Tax=Brevibacillus sp. SYP-B805 TaxID=1578199 RepID=UPI0013EC1E4A|nr:glycosyltransferase [Brevibacillus sp. SYP-B805]NGQ95718.1 glycosyltransferase [Brevibacillus sp. SYP-B805]
MERFTIFFLDHRSMYLDSLGDALGQWGNRICYQCSWNMREIEAGIAYFRPDILITVGCDLPLHSPDLNDLPALCRAYNLFHIYWATEDKIHFDSWSLPFISRIQPDCVWTIHPDCVAEYRKMGIDAQYLNFALNPRFFPGKPEGVEERYDLTMVASAHLHKRTDRYDHLAALMFPFVRANRKIHVWGGGWLENGGLIREHFGVDVPADWVEGYLPYRQTASVYHHSKIILGIQNAPDQVTQRTFEILGAGGFMLACRTPELSRMFTDGAEIAFTDHPSDTVELVSRYLEQPALRYRIGQAARQKVLQEHTYHHRLQAIWPELERMVSKKRGGR